MSTIWHYVIVWPWTPSNGAWAGYVAGVELAAVAIAAYLAICRARIRRG